MTDTEKKERFEKILKYGVLPVAAILLIAPLTTMILQGLLGALGILAGLIGGVVVVNLAPWFSKKMANVKLQLLKHEAALNPILTLENQAKEKQEALLKSRDVLQQFYAIVKELYDQIQEHNKTFPDKPSKYQEKYEKLKVLLKFKENAYKKAQKKLAEFKEFVAEQTSDWNIAQKMAAASKLANVCEDFESKLMADTAFTTIRDSLNLAFSELDVSMLDESADTVTVANNSQTATTDKATGKTDAPVLNLDVEHVDSEMVMSKMKSQKR